MIATSSTTGAPATSLTDADLDMSDPTLPLVEIRHGVYRQRPPTLSDFQIGQVVSDGMVQRYILELHPEFVDEQRISGDYVLMPVPVTCLPDSEWETCEARAAMYATRPGVFLPIVVDAQFSFIDGGHLHRAAQIRGDRTILAFVPVGVVSRLP